MSTANIIDITPTKVAVYVTFRVHGGEGTRCYEYDLASGMAIMAGADPAQFPGEQVAGIPETLQELSGDVAAGIADAVTDAAEIGLL